MNAELAYLDTSALAKRYLPEPGSAEFDAFFVARRRALISRLVVIELKCLLRRRTRMGEIDAGYEQRATKAFEDDVLAGFLVVEPLADQHGLGARALIDRLAAHPLRTLDALHLAIAQGRGVRLFATADRRQADAAQALGMEVATFG
jgi:uncharacterized protein